MVSSLRKRAESKILPQVAYVFLHGSVEKFQIVQHVFSATNLLCSRPFALNLRMLNATIHGEHYGHYGTEPRKQIAMRSVEGEVIFIAEVCIE